MSAASTTQADKVMPAYQAITFCNSEGAIDTLGAWNKSGPDVRPDWKVYKLDIKSACSISRLYNGCKVPPHLIMIAVSGSQQIDEPLNINRVNNLKCDTPLLASQKNESGLEIEKNSALFGYFLIMKF